MSQYIRGRFIQNLHKPLYQQTSRNSSTKISLTLSLTYPRPHPFSTSQLNHKHTLFSQIQFSPHVHTSVFQILVIWIPPFHVPCTFLIPYPLMKTFTKCSALYHPSRVKFSYQCNIYKIKYNKKLHTFNAYVRPLLISCAINTKAKPPEKRKYWCNMYIIITALLNYLFLSLPYDLYT